MEGVAADVGANGMGTGPACDAVTMWRAFMLARACQVTLRLLGTGPCTGAGAPGFDVILDDGGHTMQQQLVSLNTLWRHVRPGVCGHGAPDPMPTRCSTALPY